MKLKNKALEKLYDTIVNCTITIAPDVGFDSPIDKAFKDCDEKLSGSATFEHIKNLQDRIDISEKSNGILLDANLDLCTKNRDLKDRIRQLEKDLDDAKNKLKYFTNSRDDWRSRAKHEEEEKNEQVKRADNLAVQVNKVLGEKFQLQKEIEQLKKDLDALLSRTHCAEDEVERIKKDRDIWVRNNGEKQAEIAELKRKLEAREEELDAWTRKHLETTTQFDELKSQYQKLSIENKRLQYDYNTLHRKYSECQGTVDKQAEQIRNLKARLNDIYDQGQTYLWDALQNVNNVKPWDISSFYPDVSSMDDIISWDMEDFLDEYKKWQEQKETDRMRIWLTNFCNGRVCEGCPLESKEYKCGCGEAKLFATTVEGVNRAITKACEGFCEAVRDADTKITENLRKGCTFEAEVNVNKDLFEKLCGMKSEEKKSKPGELVIATRGVTTANYTEATMNAIKEAVRKFEKSLPALDSWESTITGSVKVDDILGKTDDTEHKLEYGDAVRLPWRDYDYMYIGPDEKEETLVHLFDAENHAIVTTHISNVRYNGGRILVSEEDDIRKIWKYMK